VILHVHDSARLFMHNGYWLDKGRGQGTDGRQPDSGEVCLRAICEQTGERDAA